MSGLRFCFLTTFYPPYHFGGDGIAIQRLARGLVRAGHTVTVVHDVDAYRALSREDPAEAAEALPGLEVIGLRSGAGALSPLLTQQFGRPVLNGPRIRRVLDRGFDVINYHNVSLLGGPGVLRYGKALKLYMAHEHWLVCPTHVLWRYRRELCTGRQCFRCQLSYRRPPQLWRWTGLLQRRLGAVDVFIAMSEFSRAKHREFGFPHEMQVLPPFLPEAPDAEPPVEGRPHPRPYFLFAGRLERLKGLQDVLPAFAGPGEADLLVAGEGEFGPELRGQAAGSERVHFLGRLPAEQLSRFYRHAVAVVMPSLCYETFGVTLLEAFRHATPVIARRLGPLTEIVETSGGGELFTSAAELVAALDRLQQQPEHRDALGRAGQRGFREHWSERVVVPRYLQIVRAAAERRRDQRILETLPAELAG